MSPEHLLVDIIFTLALFGMTFWYICVGVVLVMFYATIKTKKILLRILFIFIALAFIYIPLMQYLW